MTCRWPEKVAHPTREAALEAIRSLYKAGRGNPDMGVYPCGDHWHCGHSVEHFRKRIKRVLKVGRRGDTTFARGRRVKR